MHLHGSFLAESHLPLRRPEDGGEYYGLVVDERLGEEHEDEGAEGEEFLELLPAGSPPKQRGHVHELLLEELPQERRRRLVKGRGKPE